MSGIGDVFMSHLSTRPSASSSELAALVPHKPFTTVWSRLRALVKEGRLVRSSKGSCHEDDLWTLDGAVPFVAVTRVRKAATTRPRATEGTSSKGPNVWDPDHDGLEPLSGALKKGDRLLVGYPERWRHAMLCVVERPSGYFGQETLAQVWNLRDHCYGLVDAEGWQERFWRVSRLTKAQADALLDVRPELADAES